MLRSARPGDFMSTASGTLFELALAGGGFLTRHRGLTGAAMAFTIAFSFVSANAVWYQPHRHPAPIFSSWLQEPDAPAGRQARVIVAVEDEAAAMPDSRVALVQSALSDIELYTGSIDGVAGPRTRVAIETYQRQLGLEPSGVIDDELIALLGDAPRALPLPKPAPRKTVAAAPVAGQGAASEPDAEIAAVQGALHAAGFASLDIDGLMGSRTRKAILAFQQREGLPASGVVDAALKVRMKELGLLR